MTSFVLHNMDCRRALAEMPAESLDSVVSDPPYELGFAGKKWDSTGIAFDVEMWKAVLRVLKPGGHVVAFGGTRTFHRMVCGIEDAGFEIRDQLQWLYSSGFPKSHDVSKAIDKQMGVEPTVVGYYDITGTGATKTKHKGRVAGDVAIHGARMTLPITVGTSPEAKKYDGWGTMLKPAVEPICLARRPFKGSVAANILIHGVGAINIDGCRIGDISDPQWYARAARNGTGKGEAPWPANVLLDQEAAVVLDQVSEVGASRFFYVSKPSASEREMALENLARLDEAHSRQNAWGNSIKEEERSVDKSLTRRQSTGQRGKARRNTHITLKPIDLMRYLVRLVTPPGGTVLDPFAGSGTTGVAALLEGCSFVGCELSAEYAAIATERLLAAQNNEIGVVQGKVAHVRAKSTPSLFDMEGI